jgi:hypothetical protein
MVKTRTLADLKRKIVVGTELLCTIHYKPKHEGHVRTVTKVQGNGFFFEQEGSDGRFWSPYPKAADLEWLDDETFAVTAGATTGEHPVVKRWVLKIVHGRCEHGALRYSGAPGCLECAEQARSGS